MFILTVLSLLKIPILSESLLCLYLRNYPYFYSSSSSSSSSYFSCNTSIASHLLRNYKSHSSATWHQHSPISEDSNAILKSPPYKAALSPEAAKGFRSSIHISKTAWRMCMCDGSYRRYWWGLKFIQKTQNCQIDIWGRYVQKTEKLSVTLRWRPSQRIYVSYMKKHLDPYISSSEVIFLISTMSALWTKICTFSL